MLSTLLVRSLVSLSLLTQHSFLVRGECNRFYCVRECAPGMRAVESCLRRFSWYNSSIISRGISRVRIPDTGVSRTYLAIYLPTAIIRSRGSPARVDLLAGALNRSAGFSPRCGRPHFRSRSPRLRKIRLADFSHPTSTSTLLTHFPAQDF